MKRKEVGIKLLAGALVAAAALLAMNAHAQDIKLKPGAIKGGEVHRPKARDLAYCEIAPVLGKPPKVMAQFYNTSKPGDSCPAEAFAAIDAKKLAEAVKADFVYMNPTPQTARRHWVMDEIWVYKGGETVDFWGVRATWMASMNPQEMKNAVADPYAPVQIHRESKYLYKKGNTVHLMRPPEGKVVWVMQSYASEVDPTLTIDKLPQLGSKLKLPSGWKYEVKTLDRDLTIEPTRAKGIAHIVRDDLHNVYEGCGFDAACSFVP